MTHPPDKHKPRRAQAGSHSFTVWSTIALCALAGLSWGALSWSRRSTKAHPRPAETSAVSNESNSNGSASSLQEAPAHECPWGEYLKQPPRVQPNHLTEISGVFASSKSPGLLWVHNDSGDRSRIYAITEEGVPVGSVQIPARAIDWEDIAGYTDPSGTSSLYIADIGDNFSAREGGVTLHRLQEPAREVLERHRSNPLTVQPSTMRLTFSDGPVDAEALLIDPRSGQLVVISKPRFSPPGIYTGTFEEKGTLRQEGSITVEQAGHRLHLVTAADISRDGKFILVRTYSNVYLFVRQDGQSVAEALKGPACLIPGPPEPQGEAITFLTTQRGDFSKVPHFLSLSEGARPTLFTFRFRGPKDFGL